ncbi:protein kinase [Gemmatirosa kalamazoonensis]|uniref:non-specific serine/threonine protein kinase n=1 Tax=Gemmatirosa kalamazoonensis TaxID=861299 RepID=W0RBE6_9BACT|nr:protein kinase [Gemmatirosa kalamazoonensis]AHG88424.1 protein kinase [Gemmatirosa kalamazoonensis]
MTDAPESAPRPSADWSEIVSLIDALLDTPPERRDERIAELSAGDPARRALLEALLAECERESALLDGPATERFAELLTDPTPRFPDALAERYVVHEVLGQGPMATVYRAHDRKHGRDVAMKVVHPALASALGAERFLREIEILARLRHPLIVPLYDSGDAEGLLYYTMPYEAGLSLRQRLAGGNPLPLDDVARILRDVCDALAYAHERGIVHRDIKPDNVLLAGGHAVVTDFGVAKAVTEATVRAGATASGLVIGTPTYMAPEQIAADPDVDHRADVYAVGVLAYELLAGRPPFVGASRQDVLQAHLAEHPTSIDTLRPDVPPALAALVSACLAKRPAERPQSAAELVRRLDAIPTGQGGGRGRRARTAVVAALAIAAVGTVVGGAAWWRGRDAAASWRARWANARIERLTDFAGDEVDAAISADGQFVAFLADRDSVFDALVTQVGTGQFVDLTRGAVPQLYNEDVRNVGFAHDGAHVWLRVGDITSPARLALVPTLGGPLRPFLGTAVMAVWSPDGARLAYHEATPGDPVYVADADGANARRIFVSSPGVHSHYLTWSPDGRYLYFAHGVPPDEMDVWRVAVSGGAPERLTTHASRVAYPALLDDRTLLYTATGDDGTGPWLYAMDVDARVAHRVSVGVEQYVSIAASAPVPGRPRRLVATVSNANVELWSVPVTDSVADERAALRVALPTARGAAPRFAPDGSVLYLASRGGADGLWRLAGGDRGGDRGGAAEVWRPNDGTVVGAAAVSPDGARLCVPVRRRGRSTLHCMAADGSGVRAVAESLDVRGAASWSPDGAWLAAAAADARGVRIYKIPLGGGAPVRLVDSVSSNPVWSPDGRFIVYSAAPRGRSVPVAAVTPDGRPYALPPLVVDRIGESYRFLPDARRMVVKLGGFRRQDLWLLDVATGRRRPLTRLRPGESLRRFDVSPDGTRLVFERVRQNSDVVLIEVAGR